MFLAAKAADAENVQTNRFMCLRALCAGAVVVFALSGLVFMAGCSSSEQDEAEVSSAETVYDQESDSSVVQEATDAESADNNNADAENPGEADDNAANSDTGDNPENTGTQDEVAAESTDEKPAPSENALEAAAAVEALIEPIVTKDTATIEGYLNDVYFDPTVYGITEQEFIDTFFDGLTCEVIDEYDLSDGSVGVDLKIETRDGARAADLLSRAYQEAVDTDSGVDCAQVMSRVDSVSFDDPYYFTVYLVKGDDGTWQLEDVAAFGSALLGGYDPRQLMD